MPPSGTVPVSSNYAFEHAPYTWELIRGLRSGTATWTTSPNATRAAEPPSRRVSSW
jgi:sulfide:quinone oxidoreductase